MPRLAVIFGRLGPYHVARLSALCKLATVYSIELYTQDSLYSWEPISGKLPFDRFVLFDDPRDCRLPLLAHHLDSTLSRIRPDAVFVPGWADPLALLTLDWCSTHGVRAILMSESNAHDARRLFPLEFVKTHLLRLADGALVGGQRSAQYLLQLGFSPSQVFLGYDVVDNDHFAEGSLRVRRNSSAMRKFLRLPPAYFLASARFVPKKNLLRLLRAYALYEQALGPDAWDLVLLGDGPQRTDIERECSRLQVSKRVHLPGFRQYYELPGYYGLSSAFVHASTIEQWGLVVNEALASGLPVLVSERCGCAHDLVANGRNGFLFNPLDTTALARLMTQLTRMPSRVRRALGRCATESMNNWTPHRFAESALAATRPPRSSRPSASLSLAVLRGLLAAHRIRTLAIPYKT